MPTMLPKHYHGFELAFPELEKEDYEALFAAGFITPGKVKQASDDDLSAVLTRSKIKKARNGRGKGLKE